MIARDIVADVLLGLAVVIVLGASVGVLVMRDASAKLHYVTPAALVAPILVALAISSRWACPRTPVRRSWPSC